LIDSYLYQQFESTIPFSHIVSDEKVKANLIATACKVKKCFSPIGFKIFFLYVSALFTKIHLDGNFFVFILLWVVALFESMIYLH
jgi:hypothetical protein